MSLTSDEGGAASSVGNQTSEKKRQGLQVSVECKAATRIETSKKFHEKVFDLVENEVAPDALWWLEEGDVFVIRPKNFDEELSHHFRGNKFASMLRNMNRWGFVRINHSRVPFNCVAYWHKSFQRGKRHLLSKMRERKKNDKTTHDGVQLHEIYTRLDRKGETTSSRPKIAEKVDIPPQRVEANQAFVTSSSPVRAQMEAPELVASSALRNQFSSNSGFNPTSSSQLAMCLYPPLIQDKLSSILLQQGQLHRQSSQQQNLALLLEQRRKEEENLKARMLEQKLQQQQSSDSIQNLLHRGYQDALLGSSGLNSSAMLQGGATSSLLAGSVALVEEQRKREIIRLLQAAGEGSAGQHITASASSLQASLEHQRGLSALEILAKLNQLA